MRTLTILLVTLGLATTVPADEALLRAHCAKCHGGAKPKGDFRVETLGAVPTAATVELWTASLDYVRAGEMPPAEAGRLTDAERRRLVAFLAERVREYDRNRTEEPLPTRRLNNREFARSVADVLGIEDVGTHQPVGNLLGDTLHHGFDTHGESLGMSRFHLEQYVESLRLILDATILEGERPVSKRYDVDAGGMRLTTFQQRPRNERIDPNRPHLDLLDPRQHVYFDDFETVPATGRYRIVIRATGKDRGRYPADATGMHHGDPIRLRVHLGDHDRTFDLPDDDVREIVLDEWLAAGTRVELSHPTDGLRMKGNGNFKFQHRITHDWLRVHDRDFYDHVVRDLVPKAKRRNESPAHWVHWVDYWRGPRPRVFSATVEGPRYESWPPRRQVALLGENPTAGNAAAILRPIAERAWRRDVTEDELAPIVRLVEARADELGDVRALGEGIVAVLVSPSFLMLHTDEGAPADRFATKLAYFLGSTTPSAELRRRVRNGELDTFEAVLAEVRRRVEEGRADEFQREFPNAWLQLDRINFMAPDPDRYPLYSKKRISEDMVDEVLHLFRHAVAGNRPVPELLTGEYSFVNADLAAVYGLQDVPDDSTFRRYEFADGRRGGLLGTGAFLTLTADSLGTSPIHRAVYVMENFLGVHPEPPPPDVEIAEPDVRSARTIKEVLAAHAANETCAACHAAIDPWGYAFENFDPQGSWRDEYESGTTVDAAAEFRNGTEYADVVEFRELLRSDVNRERFVRCFVEKLLLYANGVEPTNRTELDRIVAVSAEHDHRIVETIAAVVDSPLFRTSAVSAEQETSAGKPATTEAFVGDWALVLDNGEAGWLTIARDDATGKWSGELWRVGQPKAITGWRLDDGTLAFTRNCRVGEPAYPGGPPTGERVACRFEATVDGDAIRLETTPPGLDRTIVHTGKRLPPLPPRPDLARVRFGEPVTLFNGRNLDGWTLANPKQRNGWKAVDGELVNDTPKETFDPFSRFGNLRTKKVFGDGRLTIEFNVPKGGNSGVYVRGAYEAQVVDRDSRMQGIHGVGSIFNRIAPLKNAGKPGGEWQRYEITIVDRHATVVLNGVTVVDNQPVRGNTNGAFQADVTRPGPLFLQGDHTSVRYRNIVFHPVVGTP